jgi:hypothetical protein
VRVKARTSLWVDTSEAQGLLNGYLADDRGDRIAGRRVSISSGNVTESVITDHDGAFEAPFPLGLRAQTLTVVFEGDPYLEPSSITREIDPLRLPVDLQLIMPTIVSLTDASIEAQVRAEHNGQPVRIAIDIVDAATSDVLSSSTTGPDGWASMAIETEALGRPGQHSFHAVFGGDASLAPSLARAEVLLVDATQVTLHASPTTFFPEDSVRFEGVLSGTFEPLSGQEIALEAGEATIGHATTGHDGAFVAELSGDELPHADRLSVVARFRSSTAARSSCVSAAVSLQFQEAQPMDWRFVTLPAGVTIMLLVVVFVLTRQRARSPRQAHARATPQVVEAEFRPSQVPMRTMRRAEHLDVSGIVMDAIEEQPVGGAAITVSGPAGTTRGITDVDGTFFVGPFARGQHTMLVEAAGYVAESFPLMLPHAGSFHEATITIVQVRHRALEIYRAAARPLLPRHSLWGLWTPRELAVNTVKTHPWLSDDVAALTSSFETLYYSSATSTIGDLERIRRLAASLDQTQRGHLTATSRDS